MKIHEMKLNAEGFTRLYSVNRFWTRRSDCYGTKIWRLKPNFM
jgi:hypothetical protein